MTDRLDIPKVLIVEDDGAIRRLLVSALQREPLIVHAAADGMQAANLVTATEYALMLVDMMLPRMNGMEFLRHFRRVRPDSSTVVLVMTAADEHVVRNLTPDLVHGIVRKPFDLPTLVATITDISSTWEAADRGPAPAGDEPLLAC
ncbi:MAG TPA: response regulator [Rhodothermales bacterium]